MEAAHTHSCASAELRGVGRHRVRRWVFITGAILLSAISMAGAWKLRYHFLERNFREVIPGQIYAGGYQHTIPLMRILER